MKKSCGLIIVLLLIAVALYLNRAYAHIFDTISAANLLPPPRQSAYAFGDSVGAFQRLYLAMGDSLTAGVGANQYEETYPYLVGQSLAARYGGLSVKNSGFPGLKAVDLLGGPLNSAVSNNPQIVTLFIGINDVYGSVNLNDFKKSYEEILSRLTEETNAKVYAVGLPVLGSGSLLWPPYNYYFDWRTRQFNQAIKELAAKYQVIYIDLYAPLKSVLKTAGPYYAGDNFHLSAAGYALIAPLIYNGIKQ